MNKLIQVVLMSSLSMSVVAGDVFFEAKGPVTDKTEGFRFGNITFTDNDRVCAKFEQIDYDDALPGRLTTCKLRLPHKAEGKGAYFKFSFDAQYTFTSGNGGKPQRCNQGIFFYDKKGKVLPDVYDTMYPGENVTHYERVLYAWDEVDTFELFFQKPWAMKLANGDRCTLNVSNVKIETATWEDAVRYCDSVYAQLPALSFVPPSDCTTLIPRTMEALETGKPWRIVLLGDSIMQDTFNSQFHALLRCVYPKSNVEWILSMRGGTGCWHYCLADNFYSYVVDHKPDLLIIGGISNYKEKLLPCKDYLNGHEAMLRVAKLARERLGCEVLLLNGALAVDTRCKRGEAGQGDDLPKMKWNNSLNAEELKCPGAYAGLRDGARALGIAWWDMQTPCYEWLYESGLPYQYYSRDYVHSGELGKQIIGRIVLEYLKGGK